MNPPPANQETARPNPVADPVDDWPVVALAQSGDVAAFNRLVLRHQDAVYTLCYRLTGNSHDAADVAQEAFFSAFRHIVDFRGGVFRAWLLRIASNACHDLHRSRKRRPADSLDVGSDGEGDTLGREVEDDDPGPEAEALRLELGEVIQRGLLALAEDQRLALVLCDQYGYDYAAIAEITSVELGTVKSRINRARRRLRDFLLSDPEYRELLPERYRLSDSGHAP